MSSNIQVFVKWKDQTIFAGEDVECTITFKNVAEVSADGNNKGEGGQHSRRLSRIANHSPTPNPNSDSFFGFKSSQALFSGRRSFSISSQRKPSHRTASSLSTPLTGSHSFPPNSGPSTPRAWQPGHGHKRSVSILSIDSEGQPDPTPSPHHHYNRPQPARGHGRSASLQVLPRRNDSYEDYNKKARTPTHAFPFPLTEAPSEHPNGNLRVDTSHLGRASRRGSLATSPIGPVQPMRAPPRRSQPPPLDFKFPAAPPAESTDSSTARTPSPKSATTTGTSSTGRLTVRDAQGQTGPAHQQLTRIISATSGNGSSRSSGEFYSVSDHSTETLGSEYTNYSVQGARPPLPCAMRGITPTVNSQALLMGYAQVSASFTVDGSLVNQSVFEEVKRKGVVGGPAGPGGLPGRPTPTEQPRKTGGFWGALKWNAIEESISGLLSNNELDGLREMRGVTSSRSIPLLSTSQSLLFVDLRLAPGEEQSYSFSFSLPKGLPASHKGKAIKISYNLVIGTQRPSGPKDPQKVNRINIPFRVFSGVNEKGEVLGHDLMSPYVLLRDEAKVQKIGPVTPVTTKNQSVSKTHHSAADFLGYVDEILEQRARSNTLFPPGALPSRRPSVDGLPQMLTCKDVIDFAILRSNQAINSRRSPNRFEIARDGERIAVVSLNRPIHRLGETIIATMDFEHATIPCFAVRASLETSEKVNPTLAIRSSASIHRTTRRIHASLFENTLHSTRVVFSPAIPITATPTIVTSGVTLDWELRFEFVTSSIRGDRAPPSGTRLLETISSDDRNQVLSALEYLNCESFEISIPLTVYGETVRERLPEENEGYSI
ncbi:Reduced growth phenotype protein 1 [Penicillium bovifimosum]|uniref:Reduced growth phenotype protein 1 n=1 Tax=Penicillium bovifimosum TaxID=126998 RepID=A0A9W9GLK0_9EURO|nr:Reduced growth phenotype protein 1 [Penicillium bovifimosum]KAJ5123875.1 Reduced growth phenotype protein 1 [Penicillium bovifimosum]